MSIQQALLTLTMRACNRFGIRNLWDTLYRVEVNTLVNTFDFNAHDISLSQQLHETNCHPLHIKRIIWFIPGVYNPFWGGIHTILRFAAFFKERWGVENCFAITGPFSAATIRDTISHAFPSLKDEEISILKSEEDLASLKGGDVSICTQWKTTFFSLKFNRVKRKCYFIQDYEPLFYPAGSISALIEETYRFGFYGITNTVSLKKIYEEYYGGKSISFTPSVNDSVFFPPKSKRGEDRVTVFFYARPDHPRNGFELGISALKKLKEKMGEKVRIVTAGSGWSPKDYGMEGVIENLGLMKYEETAELYRRCDAGLIMMFTRHPSYLPLELMACGCPVVSNYNPATTWLLHDRENCLLTRASASCIADTLHTCLTDTRLRDHIIRNGLKTVHGLSPWDDEMEKVFEYMSTGCCEDPTS